MRFRRVIRKFFDLILSSQNDSNCNYGWILDDFIKTVISPFTLNSAKMFTSNFNSGSGRFLSSAPNGFENEEIRDLGESRKVLILHKCTGSKNRDLYWSLLRRHNDNYNHRFTIIMSLLSTNSDEYNFKTKSHLLPVSQYFSFVEMSLETAS